MFDIRGFNKSIINAHEFCSDLGVLKFVQKATSLHIEPLFNDVALMPDASHETIFFAGLEHNYYNFILEDYSFFQFSLANNSPYESRLCYVPNPQNNMLATSFGDITPDSRSSIGIYNQMFEQGEIDFEEYSQAISEIESKVSAPIIRVDTSESQYKPVDHPFCHMHLGINNQSRLSLDRYMSPCLFTMFILRTFYHDIWTKCNCEQRSLENKLINEKCEMKELEPEFFCQFQSKLINLT